VQINVRIFPHSRFYRSTTWCIQPSKKGFSVIILIYCEPVDCNNNDNIEVDMQKVETGTKRGHREMTVSNNGCHRRWKMPRLPWHSTKTISYRLHHNTDRPVTQHRVVPRHGRRCNNGINSKNIKLTRGSRTQMMQWDILCAVKGHHDNMTRTKKTSTTRNTRTTHNKHRTWIVFY